jgi:hypothetical protein
MGALRAICTHRIKRAPGALRAVGDPRHRFAILTHHGRSYAGLDGIHGHRLAGAADHGDRTRPTDQGTTMVRQVAIPGITPMVVKFKNRLTGEVAQ